MSETKKPKITPALKMIEQAAKLWGKNLQKIVMVYVWGILYALAPIAILFLLLVLNETGLLSSWLLKGVAIFFAFWSVLFMVYFFVRTYIAMFLLVKKDFTGSERKIFEESKDYFWSYLVLVMLTFVLSLLWFSALVIPVFVFAIFYCLSDYAFIFESKRDIDAILRSYHLVRGYWWATFGRLALFGFALWLVILIISLPLRAVSDTSAFYYIWNSFIQIVNMLVGPMTIIFTYHLFKDLVKIKS